MVFCFIFRTEDRILTRMGSGQFILCLEISRVFGLWVYLHCCHWIQFLAWLVPAIVTYNCSSSIHFQSCLWHIFLWTVKSQFHTQSGCLTLLPWKAAYSFWLSLYFFGGKWLRGIILHGHCSLHFIFISLLTSDTHYLTQGEQSPPRNKFNFVLPSKE